MNAKKPFYDTHEINTEETGTDSLELFLNSITYGEEYEIINIEAQSKRDKGCGIRGVIWILNKFSVETGVICILLEAHGAENTVNFVIPVLGTLT